MEILDSGLLQRALLEIVVLEGGARAVAVQHHSHAH